MRVITGSARGVHLKTPAGLDTRPTTDRVKENLFNIIQFETPGARVLDLFAGSGQLGIEALSRGANAAVFIEHGKEAFDIVKQNLKATKLQDKAQVIQTDAFSYLDTCRGKFDLIFLDPPYSGKILEKALVFISEIDILSDGGIIICERSIEKNELPELANFTRSKDYKYGKTLITLYHNSRSEVSK
jgi:16S rRNA (guanine966-N2)-methyltransferase